MTLSIIIPTLNEENYVGKLLQSLCEQTYADFEVIVVDGQSEDKTIEVVKSFSSRLDLKVILARKRNIAYQRNLGAANARGDLLLFLDADIMLKEYFLERALQEIKNRNLNIAGCYFRPIMPRAGRLSLQRTFDMFVRQIFFNSVLFLAQFTYPLSPGGGTFSKNWLHKKLGGYDLSIKLGEDHDYARRASKITKFRLLRRTILVSMRREDAEGRLKILIKYVLATFHKLLLGEIRSDVFRYKFGHYGKKN